MVLGLGTRLALALAYRGPAVNDPDSHSYTGMAAHLFGLSSTNYLGVRNPGYPAIIRALGDDLSLVWALQAVLGIATSVILFQLVRRAIGRAGIALVTALVLPLSLDVLFFEANILTEAVVTFLLTASAGCAAVLMRKGFRLRWATLLGLLTAFAAVTRPETVMLCLLWPGALLVARGGVRPALAHLRAHGKTVAAMALPGLLAATAWAGVNAHLVGQFTTSTLTGPNLVDHLGSSVAEAPDRFAAVRDPYVHQQRVDEAAGLGDADVSFRAMAAMQQASGKSFVPLSRELTAMSVDVIAHHPSSYLAVTLRSWCTTWLPFRYWDSHLLRSGAPTQIEEGAWKVELPVRVALNLTFLLLAASMVSRRFRRDHSSAARLACLLALVVVVMSVPQALLANGQNARYLAPYLPVELAAVALGLTTWIRILKRSADTSSDSSSLD